MIVVYIYKQIEKLSDVMLEEEKVSRKYMLIILGIQKQANCCF